MKTCFCYLLLACLAFTAAAQPPQINIVPVLKESSPESAGFSSERLARIDKVMNEFVDKQSMNGGVAMIIRDGKIIYHKAFGYENINTKTPMQKDAIFR